MGRAEARAPAAARAAADRHVPPARAVHVSPEEAVAAHDALGAGTSVGIHFGTFPLADDGEAEAVETLRRALPAGREDFWVLDFGEGRDVP